MDGTLGGSAAKREEGLPPELITRDCRRTAACRVRRQQLGIFADADYPLVTTEPTSARPA